jgi:hypothetical protein
MALFSSVLADEDNTGKWLLPRALKDFYAGTRKKESHPGGGSFP